MFNIIIGVLCVGLLFLIIGFIVKLRNDKKLILSTFKRCNVIVYGKKGAGKDLLFNYVINNRKSNCASNIQFNDKYCRVKPLDDYLLKGIDYEKLIHDNFEPIEDTFTQHEDYYISDAGIHLPAQYHGLLERDYKSFPITYALSRHIGEFNIHCNSQNLTRPWDKLREQADAYICCKRTYHIFGLLFTKMVYYEKYESAKANLMPFHVGLFSKQAEQALCEQYDATNGMIKTCYIVQRAKNVKYDTRAFYKKLFGKEPPKTDKFSLKGYKKYMKRSISHERTN